MAHKSYRAECSCGWMVAGFDKQTTRKYVNGHLDVLHNWNKGAASIYMARETKAHVQWPEAPRLIKKNAEFIASFVMSSRASLILKLSPRKLKLSPKMRWIIDAVTGQDYGARGPMGQAPTHLNITSDGFVTTGGAGSEGAMFIGGFESFHNNLVGVLDTVEATEPERQEFWTLYLKNVTDWRR
jgi:hypothetical protein